MIAYLIAALVAPMPTANPLLSPPSHACQKPDAIVASGGKAQFRRLDELPNADMVMAVVRMKDGCLDPLIKATNIGKREAAGKR